MSYRLHDYVAMIADPHRTGAYARAMQQMVRPDSVVLDLGTGFGFFAVLAARLGARHVYAIEPNDAVSLGPELARANGVGDRVTFFRGDSRDIVFPERANLLVEDVRGVLPFHGERIRLLCDARERLLTPDARVVAVRDHLFAAPTAAPRHWAADQAVLHNGVYGVDLGVIARRSVDAWLRGKVRPEQLLLDAAPLGSVDLATVEETNFDGTASWTVSTAARIDGFVVWFEAELAEGERFSTAPGPEQTVHQDAFFPLREPLEVTPGDGLSFRFVGVQAGPDYGWVWECATRSGAAGAWTHGPRQSTIISTAPISATGLGLLSGAHRPVLGREGVRYQHALALIDGRRTSDELAAALAALPDCGFRDSQTAFNWLVGTLRELSDEPGQLS